MDVSPTKKVYEGPAAEERPFPGQMAENYRVDDIAAIRENAARARSKINLSQGRTLGKTVSEPILQNGPSLFTNGMASPPFMSPTRAPLHSRDASMNELQPYGDLKNAPNAALDGFDVEEMDFTPHASPTPSPRKRRVMQDDEEEDEAVAMDEDPSYSSPSRRMSPIKGLATNRMLGRAQTEPALSFDDSF